MLKKSVLTLSLVISSKIFAFEAPYLYDNSQGTIQSGNTDDTKVTFLTKLVEEQQKSYEDKIAYLEAELKKSNERLVEKSLNQDKIHEVLKDKYEKEIIYLKREIAYKTKSLLERDRLLEKVKPSDDMKTLIKLNTELASELRRTEDQIAVYNLKKNFDPNYYGSQGRLPASVKGK